MKDRFLPDKIKAKVRANEHRFALFEPGRGCAGVEYPLLVAGQTDFLFYWRTLPWDHAPGVLFAQEAGFQAVRPNGDPYRCGSTDNGLVVAHQAACNEIRVEILA
ncbi:MAG: hypothetical protein GY929_20725 [Actinomycetia bacterium]|nr:hypothetical protein [Actinomycetes bacterium]